jgi:hypothetical protein
MPWIKLGPTRVNIDHIASVTESVGNSSERTAYVVIIKFADGSHAEHPIEQCRKLLRYVDAQALDFATRAY